MPFLPSDPVIAEAGAHVGHDAPELGPLSSSGTIDAFEPIPHLPAVDERDAIGAGPRQVDFPQERSTRWTGQSGPTLANRPMRAG